MSAAEQFAFSQGVTQPLRLQEGIVRGDLARILQKASQDAERQMLINLKRAGITSKVKAAQMKAAMDGLGSLSSSMWGQIGGLTRAGVYQASELAATQQMDREYLTGMPFKAMQQYQQDFYFSAYQSAEDIISRRTNGFALADRIYAQGRTSVLEAGRIVEQGLAQQVDARSLAKQVRNLYDPAVPGGTSYAAMRLARTEINNAHHDTTIRLTKEQPWVTHYRWHLSGSHPKPDECNEYAETDHAGMGPGVYAKGGIPSKPHPHCFCYLEVFQEDRDAFLSKLTSGQYDEHLSSKGVRC